MTQEDLLQKLREYLKSSGHDRAWLADHLGVSKGTVNNWFTAKRIPEGRRKVVERLLVWGEHGRSELKFSYDQWKDVQDAFEKSGEKNLGAFIHKVVGEAAKKLGALAVAAGLLAGAFQIGDDERRISRLLRARRDGVGEVELS